MTRTPILTNRELAVLASVAAGHSNRQIAAELLLGVHTVSRVRTRIIHKLGASHMPHAVAIGFRDRILPDGGS